MNIFILDRDIETCARYHCDQHVSKMILESVQLLCSSLNKQGYTTPYRSTHIHHPCVLWLEESYANWRWLRALALALNREYRYRYQREVDHASIAVLAAIGEMDYIDRGLTEFAQAMPVQYKYRGNAVRAYRAFYRGEKAAFATWTRRAVPRWMQPA